MWKIFGVYIWVVMIFVIGGFTLTLISELLSFEELVFNAPLEALLLPLKTIFGWTIVGAILIGVPMVLIVFVKSIKDWVSPTKQEDLDTDIDHEDLMFEAEEAFEEGGKLLFKIILWVIFIGTLVFITVGGTLFYSGFFD